VREDQVTQVEKKLEARERALNERQALLEAHIRVAESGKGRTGGDPNFRNEPSASKSEAIHHLETELKRQEAALLQAQEALRERERYIEQCENELAERALDLDAREAELREASE